MSPRNENKRIWSGSPGSGWAPWLLVRGNGVIVSWALLEMNLKPNQLFPGDAEDEETTFPRQKEKEVTGIETTEGNPWLGKIASTASSPMTLGTCS